MNVVKIDMHYLFIFFTLICLTGFSQLQTFNHNGTIRNYIYYEPTTISPGAPLVVVMHGYSGSANGIKNYSGMNTIADINGFAVCYPQGTSDSWNNNFWNVGYDFHPNETVDDVDFIISLVDFLKNQHNLSSVNTFATGMSNGGEMSYMLACQAPQSFSAVASVAGTMFDSYGTSCGTNAVPVMEIHGTNDGINLWNGDYNNSTGWGIFYDIDSIIDFWSNNNQCNQINTENFPDINPNDGSTVIAEKHSSTTSDNEVWLYKVVNGGHDWPGAFGNMDINSSEHIWLFFSKFLSSTTFEHENIAPNASIKKILYHTDLLGRKVSSNHKGIIIRIYSDGTTEKTLNIDNSY